MWQGKQTLCPGDRAVDYLLGRNYLIDQANLSSLLRHHQHTRDRKPLGAMCTDQPPQSMQNNRRKRQPDLDLI
jgi:hypothetical protein